MVLVPQSVSYLDPLMKVGEQVRRGQKDKESVKRCRESLGRYVWERIRRDCILLNCPGE